MTLYELLHKVSFEDLIPTLESLDAGEIYPYREAFDELMLIGTVEEDDGESEFVLDEEVCGRFEEYREATPANAGIRNYAVFSAHDELIGDSSSLDNMAIVFDVGYSILIDAKGGHRLRKTTLKLLKEHI